METAARFLEIDRLAGLGRLGGGVVHALNNVLAAFLGQLDLLMCNPAAESFRGELEKILTACEEGSELTRSLMLITHSLQDTESMSAGDLVNELLKIMSRLYRRQGLDIVKNIEYTEYIHDATSFTQAAFHSVLLGFIAESRSQQNNRSLTCTLEKQEGGFRLIMKTTDSRFERPAPDSLTTRIPPESYEDDYHFWIIDRICQENGSWEISDDKSELVLNWRT